MVENRVYSKSPANSYINSFVLDLENNISEDWGICRLKFLLSSLESGNRESGGGNQLDEGVFSLGGEHISWDGKFIPEPPKFISVEFYKKLNKGKVSSGDVLLVKDGATIGKTLYVSNIPFDKCAVNEHVFILRGNDKNHKKFLYYLVSSKLGFDQIIYLIKGAAQPGLDSRFINDVVFPVPPISDQQTIVNFLDQNVKKINDLIAKKEHLVEILEEKRSALIAGVVTKGLNHDVEMRDSGIEWLGDIPAHWKLERGKHIFTKLNRPSLPENGVVTAFRDGEVTLRSNRRTEGFTFSIKEIGYQGVKKGDLVIHEMDGFAGAIGVSDSNGNCSPIYSILQPMKSTNNYYYAYLLRFMAHSGYITSLAKGIRERSTDFRFKTFGNEFLPVLPLKEQNNIVNFLNQKTTEINTLVEKIRTMIETLTEYRTGITSAAVTGKIDVRQ